MPITEDEFRTIDENTSVIDLTSDTTQGRIYRFLLENADKAFRQREIVDHVDVPRGSVGPTLKRFERRGLVEHRGHYWKISDAEHATASAGLLGAATADEIDGGFSDEQIDEWMETAVDPIDGRDEDGGGEA
ncbi:winged helix-turn-helix domain-containing protein [Halalkalirubrum salinum]|uniref:winged helix-turn-helix domain-containing protein n=1 Tax=Halalkalirubrum salinum TaxID=2563889 RepID=UPI00197AE17C|nr:winged helix-turn-helix domain-containing protein [Halalkalirubrum salinum]